jgi:drug/metabolite transporter (DMT)-like permease
MGLFCFFYGLTQLPLSTATTLNYTSPLFLAILSFVLYKEKINKQMGVSLLLGFIGVVILLQPTLGEGQLFAAIVAVLAGAFGGWAYVQVKDLANKGEPEWRIVFYFSVVSTVMAGVLSTINGWHPVAWADVGYLLGIGFTALVAQMSMTRAYKVGQKFVVASLSYLTVVFATIFGVLLFNDVVTWQEIIGMVVIVASGLLSSVKKVVK